ncbi:hippocampus abundant transcript-like protein 1 isoform X2 [Benincasa hispida]|uniref:hippocampus abundant transcript-like protein 1 isoform X2 n=1 Tax=Benincasa hispida TaxID=102211 RepID=UPI0018FFF60E|nr:hippocampus abundant transcript-like protein 1 isoform X2 [Benincasa hispida]
MELIIELRHLFATVFLGNLGSNLVFPAIADITMDSVCPGRRDQCSLAFYLTAFQQAISGLGAMILTPWIGSLSDKYGRKSMLTFPIVLSIFPHGPKAILAYKRTTSFFYAYYVMKMLIAMISHGTLISLALAYAADKVSAERRISAFGIVSGVFMTSFLCGNLAARFLSIAAIFQVAMCLSLIAILYMRIFLEESISIQNNSLSHPISKMEYGGDGDDDDDFSQLASTTFETTSSLNQITSLLRRRSTFSRTATVYFFHSIALGWTYGSLQFYLKGRFHSNKDQFASLSIIIGGLGAISQTIVASSLSAVMGDKKLLSVALFATFIQMLILSISWSFWVVYASSSLFLLSWCVLPAACSIASKQVESHEQGKAQGCLSGIQSFAYAISPLVFNPLAALFLSEDAPFNFPGFTILCLAFTTLMAFVFSLTIKVNQVFPLPPI